ncbi:MAG: Gfo/Idh/MocA family oxidoreductase [Candidatus Neomarinimicrobiota bacterium]
MRIERKLKMGMVGGGPGAFIGDVHRKAALMNGKIDLVAGAFSRDPEKSKPMARELFLEGGRAYGNYIEMIEKESRLPEGIRIDFVSIVTPNNLHFPVARDFLKKGFHVVCDKPMTVSVQEAKELRGIVEESLRLFAVTHNYTGYPMVKLARDLIRRREIGKIRKAVVTYPQGWLSTPLEQTGNKQAAWRTDPEQSGPSGCMGDIGTHAGNLTEYVTGLKITHVCADLTTFVEDRRLDDDGNCLLRFDSGAKGVLHTSQISVGEENDLAIRVYGEKKSVEWHQEHPDHLKVKELDGPAQTWSRGNEYVHRISPGAARATRLPSGHPEGYIEAFANIYRNFAETLLAQLEGVEPDELALDFPSVEDGVRSIQFIEAVLASSKSEKKWTAVEK